MSVKRHPLSSALVFLILFGLTSCDSKKQQTSKTTEEQRLPNIILILADDMGYGDLSSYGQTTLVTPNIDRLVSQGMKFTSHYTGSTVCAPSRASLLTGLHTGHVSVRGNEKDQMLTEVTIPSVLKQVGYKTGMIGKWGVGGLLGPDDPQRNGFDHSYGYINMWHAHNFYPEFLYRNGKKEMLETNRLARDSVGNRKWVKDQPEGTGVADIKGQHTHPLFETDALAFIEENKDGPFFLYLALNMPHANNEHPTDGMEVPDYGKFESKDWPQPEKGFARMIQMIDETVGKVDKKLQDLGISENTLLVFCSDNGPHQEGFHNMEFFDSNGDLRGMKRDLYDGGVRTPFIAKWPGQIQAGSTSNHLSAFWDIMPTLCDISGATLPQKSDGISFLPTLLGESGKQEKHPFLYWEFYERGGKQAVLKDNFKAVKLDVRTGDPQPIQLFDLRVDPGEENDIANKHPELVSEMAGYIEESHVPLESISLFDSKVLTDTQF